MNECRLSRFEFSFPEPILRFFIHQEYNPTILFQ